MLKLQRNYYCEFILWDDANPQKIKEIVTISYPTTITFNVSLGSYNTPNNASLQFINLSKEVQGKIWRDYFNTSDKIITFNLYAGYGNSLVHIFSGWVDECTSYRQSGSTNWTTEVRAVSGANIYQFGILTDTFTKGTKVFDILRYMTSKNSDIKLGSISPSLDYSIPRNQTFIGQPMDLIGRNFADYRIFIDKNELHILGKNEVIEGERLFITDKTGLLGSPKRANLYLETEMLFEPQANLGRMATLKSESMPQFNGDYEIISIRHYGTISATQSGTLITSMVLAKPNGEIKVVPKQEEKTYSGDTTSAWQKPVNGKVTSPFGYRTDPVTGAKKKFHNGIDIGASLNTPVKAAAAGMVTMANWYGGYGKCVQMDNGTSGGKKISTLYGHLNSWTVQNGAMVMAGQVIGYVGSTGKSTGAHLHFEVRENGTPVQPTKYIGNF